MSIRTSKQSSKIAATKRFTALLAAVALPALLAQPALADHDDKRVKRVKTSQSSGYQYARVIDVKPLIRTVRVEIPVRECYEQPVNERRERPGAKRGDLGRTIAGGIIGGVIGRQFGDGSGRDAMTVLGTVIGAASASDNNDRRRGSSRYEDEPARYCETTYEYEERDRVEGYRVTYRFNGENYTTRTAYDPGDEIRVRVSVTPVTR